MRHVAVAESGPLARLRLQMLQNSESRMFMLRVLKPCQCEIATDELEIRYGKNVQRAANAAAGAGANGQLVKNLEFVRIEPMFPHGVHVALPTKQQFCMKP